MRRECVICTYDDCILIAKYNEVIEKWMVAQPYPVMTLSHNLVKSFKYCDEIFNLCA